MEEIVRNTTASLHEGAPKPTDQDIHDRIFDAILSRRLQPGMRLGEEALAGLFGVSRTKVRHAIAKLTQDGVVQVRRNSGASIATPTRAEARHVVEYRCLLEPPVAAALARAQPGSAQTLRPHVAQEHAARVAGDDALLIRLTGAFHHRLAALHGNALIARAVREAEALTCLSILSYGRPNAAACLPDEHGHILTAIERGDAEQAALLMLHHLHHVAAGMDLAEPQTAGLAAALDVPATMA